MGPQLVVPCCRSLPALNQDFCRKRVKGIAHQESAPTESPRLAQPHLPSALCRAASLEEPCCNCAPILQVLASPCQKNTATNPVIIAGSAFFKQAATEGTEICRPTGCEPKQAPAAQAVVPSCGLHTRGSQMPGPCLFGSGGTFPPLSEFCNESPRPSPAWSGRRKLSSECTKSLHSQSAPTPSLAMQQSWGAQYIFLAFLEKPTDDMFSPTPP